MLVKVTLHVINSSAIWNAESVNDYEVLNSFALISQIQRSVKASFLR